MQPQTEKREMKTTTIYYAINAVIQLFAFFAYAQYAIFWPYYIVILMLTLLIAAQTIEFSIIEIVKHEIKETEVKKDYKMLFLVSTAYMVSCYQLYIIGYTIFAVVAFTHVAIVMLASILRSIK